MSNGWPRTAVPEAKVADLQGKMNALAVEVLNLVTLHNKHLTPMQILRETEELFKKIYIATGGKI